MDHNVNTNNGGPFMLLGSVLLYIISRFTASELASIATIFAGTMTGLFYLIKAIKELKSGNKPKTVKPK